MTSIKRTHAPDWYAALILMKFRGRPRRSGCLDRCESLAEGHPMKHYSVIYSWEETGESNRRCSQNVLKGSGQRCIHGSGIVYLLVGLEHNHSCFCHKLYTSHWIRGTL